MVPSVISLSLKTVCTNLISAVKKKKKAEQSVINRVGGNCEIK